MWEGKVDDWVYDEDDGLNEGVCDDGERISLWVSDSYFVVFIQGGGRGNSNGRIPKSSLYDQVNLWEEGKCEETLAWDNLDSSWDKEIPCNLWIKGCTSRVFTKEGWFDFFWETLVDYKHFFHKFTFMILWSRMWLRSWRWWWGSFTLIIAFWFRFSFHS